MRRTALLILWLVTDLALFLGAYALSYFLRVGWVLSTEFPFDRFLVAAILVTPVWLGTLIMTRTFSLMRNQSSKRTGMYIAYAGIVALAFFSLAYYFLYKEFFSRLLLVYALPLSILPVWAWHVAFEQIQRIVLRTGSPVYPTLIVGATREAATLIRSLQKNRNPLKPVAVLDGRGTSETAIEGVPVAGRLHKLDETLEKYRITHLVQCSDLEQSINLLTVCRQRGITYLVLPSVFGIIEGDERIETIEGRPLTVVRPKESSWRWFFS